MRAILAVIGGIIVWSALFMVVGIAFGLAWPGYRAAARLFFESQDFGLFTMPMMLTNFVLFVLVGLASGWLVAQFGRSRTASLAFTGMLLAYGLIDHYYLLWGVLPDWYNLVVPWIIAGSIYVGAGLTPRPSSARVQAV